MERIMLPQWSDHIAALAGARDALEPLADPRDPLLEQGALKLLFQGLASGVFTAFGDPDFPDFVPAMNSVLNAAMTNPDFVYGTAMIDGAGTYRISGERGDSLFVLFDIAAGGLGVMEKPGPTCGTIDLDSLALDADGRFELLLSAERPTDWAGNWHRLDPAATTINMREARYDWRGRDGRFAIDRIDRPHGGRPRDAAALAERLAALARYPQRFAGMWVGVVRAMAAKGLWNRFEHDDWAGRGGVAGQHYYQGLFDIPTGHILLLETEIPDRVRYWNVQLGDLVWNTVDWMNHQSSLNGGQARMDADGRFRAVIALEDPGVPNWLDPGGNRKGAIMLRWTEGSSGPAPTLRAVPFDALRDALPRDTPMVDAMEREKSLRQRRTAFQMRRRW